MTRVRSRRRVRRRSLTDAERHALIVGALGPFDDDDDRRQAWTTHRAELLAECPPDEPPEAWWNYAADDAPAALREYIVSYPQRPPWGPLELPDDPTTSAYALIHARRLKAQQHAARRAWLAER